MVKFMSAPWQILTQMAPSAFRLAFQQAQNVARNNQYNIDMIMKTFFVIYWTLYIGLASIVRLHSLS